MQKQILRLTTPTLRPKEHKSLFGDPMKKALGAPFAQDDSFGLVAAKAGLMLGGFAARLKVVPFQNLVRNSTLLPSALEKYMEEKIKVQKMRPLA